MTNLKVFIKKHPLLVYYCVVFVISWGCILVAFGPAGVLTKEAVYFIGPISLAGPSIAGILLTIIVNGKGGLRDLLSRLFRWRVGLRWYAVALLTAPILYTAITLMLLQTSRDFLPDIVTSDSKTSILLSGISAGIMVSIFEELGWTGFATPQWRKRYGILTTGLIMGLLWGLWHLPLFLGSALASQTVSPPIYLLVMLFSWLPPYRILMVWVYDHTRSLLLGILMHLPIVVAQFVRFSSAMSETQAVIDMLILAAALWIMVAAVQRQQTVTRQAHGTLPG